MKATLMQEPFDRFLIAILPDSRQEKEVLRDIASGAMIFETIPCEEPESLMLRVRRNGTSQCPVCGKDTPHSHPAPADGALRELLKANMVPYRTVGREWISHNCTEHLAGENCAICNFLTAPTAPSEGVRE